MNSWPSHQDIVVIQKDIGKLSKIRRIASEIVPLNIATLVWLAMVIFPSILSILGSVTESSVDMNYSMSGGLSNIMYSYWGVHGDVYYPTIVTIADFILGIASVTSPLTLLMWSLNLWLGLATFQFILGKSTKKRVYILAVVIILVYAIPALLMSLSSLIFGMVYLSIPLPFYPIIMLLVARFVHAPVPEDLHSDEMIQVPLSTRISSFFSRRKGVKESTTDLETDSIEDQEISDT
jgi:hypothetical protein